MGAGHNRLRAFVPPAICEFNLGNICRGAVRHTSLPLGLLGLPSPEESCHVVGTRQGACDTELSACSCADGASGAFCETVDQEGFAQLMFTGRCERPAGTPLQ